MTIIDINHLLNGPDADCVYTDDQGVKWLKFDVSFCHDDRSWAFSIWALDQQDAEARVRSIAKNGAVLGQVMATVDG